MKKLLLLTSLFIISIVIISSLSLNFESESEVVSQLSGKIYYTKRVGETLYLYTASANLTNEKLIYSHQGEQNNNIIDYYYDDKSELIYFVAMKNNQWSLFSISEDEKIPTYIKQYEWDKFSRYYIQNEYNDMKLVNKTGSLYLVKNGEEQLLKKFIGLYDSKFNSGYIPIGFSPDGKFIIYHASEHLTPIGTILEGFIDHDYNIGQNYIMELETKKIEKYPSYYAIQWVMDKN